MENSLKDYIEANIPDLLGRMYPVMVVAPEEGINVAYTFTDISADHLNQSQLTLNVICDDYDSGMEIHRKIQSILAMEEDEPFVVFGNVRFRSRLSSGGGRIYNEEIQKWELSKYYIIDWRMKNV